MINPKLKWECIVEDNDLKTRIESKIDEIKDAVLNQQADNSKIGLFTGKAGFSLFFFYLNKYNNNDNFSDAAESFLSESIDSLNNGHTYFPFCDGITGILWAILHLNNERFIESDCSFEEITSIVEKKLMMYAEEKNFDYLHGALGMSLYLLSHGTRNHSSCLTNLISILSKNGIAEKDTIKWETLIKLEPHTIGYGISLSHGISGTIIFLIKILKKEPTNKLAFDLLNKAINYLTSIKNDPGKNLHSQYPSYMHSSKSVLESRLSWCYGDLGIAVALYAAGNQLKDKKLEFEAIDIMLHASKRRHLEENGLLDACFCHGTIGVAHIFNRFYQHTKIVTFKETALYWIEKTIGMSHFSDGPAGYKKYTPTKWENDYSLLEGITGIGLSLISTIGDVEPTWDSAFLLS